MLDRELGRSPALLRRGALLAAGVLALGCDAGNPFVTAATYEAPVSGFRVHLRATGVVPAGADLADSSTGTVRICPVGAAPGARAPITVRFASPRDATFSIDRATVGSAAPATGAWHWSAAELTALLAAAGYAEVSPDEARETIRVLGAVSGPKALVLTGQTTVLTVVATEYEYGRAAAARDSTAALPPCP
jgi:hypothetical protein